MVIAWFYCSMCFILAAIRLSYFTSAELFVADWSLHFAVSEVIGEMLLCSGVELLEAFVDDFDLACAFFGSSIKWVAYFGIWKSIGFDIDTKLCCSGCMFFSLEPINPVWLCYLYYSFFIFILSFNFVADNAFLLHVACLCDAFEYFGLSIAIFCLVVEPSRMSRCHGTACPRSSAAWPEARAAGHLGIDNIALESFFILLLLRIKRNILLATLDQRLLAVNVVDIHIFIFLL